MAQAPPTSTLQKSQQAIVLTPGQCVTLPANAVVTDILITGSASVNSDCGDLPLPSIYKCGFFAFFLNSEEEDGNVLDETTTYYTSIKVGGTTYVLEEKVIAAGENPGLLTTVATLNLHITNLPLFEFKALTRNDEPNNRQLIYLFFKAPESLFDTLKLKISDRGTFYNLEPIEEPCDSYITPA